jgi:hypothetical protein
MVNTILQKTKKSLLRPVVIFLVGILLIFLSFAFWYFIVSPIVSLGTYNFNRGTSSASIDNGSSVTLYIRTLDQEKANTSTPTDYSMSMSLVLGATGPIEMKVYVRDSPFFSFRTTNATQRNLEFNSTKYGQYNDTGRPTWLNQSISSSVPVSLIDAFTGGTTPYFVITNLNSTGSVSVTYSYSYSAQFRSSDGITLLFFVVGVIIVVGEGIVLIRRLVGRARGR